LTKKDSKNKQTNYRLKLKKSFKEKYGYNWRETKKSILARDNYTCQICKTTKKFSKLTAHHINPDEETIQKNLITLCKKCHKKEHKRIILKNSADHPNQIELHKCL
jgi:5-methylcytosine-specific restriction endonuclease McrA